MSTTNAQASATVPAMAPGRPATKGTPICAATHERLKQLAHWNSRTIRAQLERMIDESHTTEWSMRAALATAAE